MTWEQAVAEKCDDYNIDEDRGFELLPRIAYTNSINTAMAYYQKSKPRIASFVAQVTSERYIPVPTNLNPPFDAAKGSRIEKIEFLSRNASATQLYNLQAMVAYVRKDVYITEYSEELNQWVIRFIGKITGTYRVFYSYMLDTIDQFKPDEREGLLMLAAADACRKIASKFARIFSGHVPADYQAYREKSNYFMDLAKEYEEYACNLLDMRPDAGGVAYSTVASWGVRKVRRII